MYVFEVPRELLNVNINSVKERFLFCIAVCPSQWETWYGDQQCGANDVAADCSVERGTIFELEHIRIRLYLACCTEHRVSSEHWWTLNVVSHSRSLDDIQMFPPQTLFVYIISSALRASEFH